MEALQINIRPEVTILSVLQHLNYRPWFALAEFVDNSLQSFLSHEAALSQSDGELSGLRIGIDIDTDGPGKIVIRDNAAGIALADFPRAFRPAELPSDRTGLSEFGMGMKSAACWFARKWSVRTKALGESVERTVAFDIDQIVSQRQDLMLATSRPADPSLHYTEVSLEDLHHPPKGRTIGKIRDHLQSIYRVFLRARKIEILFNGRALIYEEPGLLSASYYRNPNGPKVLWRKDVNFDFGKGQRVTGFAGLRDPGSVLYAGFALFRRNRLIEGSADETYRPGKVFGNSNSYRYQRLFGELHLEGFEISHTKDGFRWEEYEDEFLDLLKEELEKPPLDLLGQAEGFRVRATASSLSKKASAATDTVAYDVQKEVPALMVREQQSNADHSSLPSRLPVPKTELASRTVALSFASQKWEVMIRTTLDPAQGNWLSISENTTKTGLFDQNIRYVAIEASFAHPFVTAFIGANNENIELFVRTAVAIALALIMAEDAAGVSPSFALHYLNTLLRDALSGEQMYGDN